MGAGQQGKDRTNKGNRKSGRGSPLKPPRAESGVAYAVFRDCGVEVEDGADLKACLSRTLGERPLELMSKCCDLRAINAVKQAMQCDRHHALLEIYVEMRMSGKERRDGIMAWNPAKGGLVPYLRRGSVLASLKLCAKEQRSPWGRTVSLDEPRFGSDNDPDSDMPIMYLDRLAAKPEPGVCVCARY